MGPRSHAATLRVDYPLAASVARLLTMFAEFPSTPETLADEAAAAARDVSVRLPFPHGPGGAAAHHRQGGPPPSVMLERETVVASAGLLGLLAGLPSTPPDLRAEAEGAAESLWRRDA